MHFEEASLVQLYTLKTFQWLFIEQICTVHSLQVSRDVLDNFEINLV